MHARSHVQKEPWAVQCQGDLKCAEEQVTQHDLALAYPAQVSMQGKSSRNHA